MQGFFRSWQAGEDGWLFRGLQANQSLAPWREKIWRLGGRHSTRRRPLSLTLFLTVEKLILCLMLPAEDLPPELSPGLRVIRCRCLLRRSNSLTSRGVPA